MKDYIIIVRMATLCLIFFHPLDLLAEPNPDTGPGCGLGKQVWSNYPKYKSIAPQMMMASTNVTGSYWFAIASGTSGCTNDGYMMAEHKAIGFVTANLENISQELAQGHGEHLTSLAELLGIHNTRHDSTFALWQDRYSDWFRNNPPSPEVLILALREP